MQKKSDEYPFKARCHVCGVEFWARYNVGDRARVCTLPSHKCRSGKIKDRKVSCVDKCCRSKYYRGASSAASSSSLDSRKFLNEQEYEKVVAASRKIESPYGIAIRFSLETGARCGEVLLVRRHHVELKDGPLSVIRIPTLKKSGHPELPVHLDNDGWFIRELRAWVKNFKPDDCLFQMAKRTFQRAFEKLLDKIKPDRASLVHILRHTRASRLVRSGLDPNTIREEMRWASIELLSVYSHTTEQKVAEALKKIR